MVSASRLACFVFWFSGRAWRDPSKERGEFFQLEVFKQIIGSSANHL